MKLHCKLLLAISCTLANASVTAQGITHFANRHVQSLDSGIDFLLEGYFHPGDERHVNQKSEKQLNSERGFSGVYPKQEYLEDLDELARMLTQTHPHPYEFTSIADFWKLVDTQKNSIDETTTCAEFIWKCSQLTASIGCSHTSLGWFNQETRLLPIDLRFPLEAKLIDDRLYISDPLTNGDKLSAGTEIFSINGKSIQEIKADVFKHINSQGKTESYKRLLFNGYFTAYVAYSLGFPRRYEVLVKGRNKPVALSGISEYKPKPRISPLAECQENLCLGISEGDDYAVLTVRSFAYYGQEQEAVFKSFLDKSVREIHARNVRKLIIDLRMNGGGSTFAATYLLKHLVEKPFTYFAQESANNSDFDYKQPIAPSTQRFQGDVFVLIDGDGHSATGHFASFVKARKLATFIGEELGSNQFCTGAQQPFSLANTGINFSVATNTWFTSVEGFPRDRGVMPDHNVVQGIDDYLNGIDTVMVYAKNLASEK